MYEAFNKKFAKAITIVVILCILGVVSPHIIEEIFYLGENDFPAIIFTFISTGVFISIYFITVKGEIKN